LNLPLEVDSQSPPSSATGGAIRGIQAGQVINFKVSLIRDALNGSSRLRAVPQDERATFSQLTVINMVNIIS